MSAPLRFAQLGTAHAHAAGKAAVMRASPDVALVGVWEPDAALRATAQTLPEYDGVPWLHEIDDALGDPTVVAVAVEGDVFDNLALAERSVLAGKHVWLDKPPGANMTAFRNVLALAAERDLLVQLGYMFRYNPGARFVLDWASSGRLGEIHAVQGRISLTPKQSKRLDLARVPGGPAFEILCHVIDLVVYLLGRPENVVSRLRDHVTDLSGAVNNTAVMLEYPSALAVLQSTAFEVDHAFRRLEVHGTRGSVALGPFEPPAVRLCLDRAQDGLEQGVQEIPLTPEPRYVASLASIVAVIRGEHGRDRSMQHELMVQETILRAVGRLPEPSGDAAIGGTSRPITPGSGPSSSPPANAQEE